MIIKEMSIRELSLSGADLENFDIVAIRDKKRNKDRGYFISHKYAREVEKFIQQKKRLKEKETQAKIKKLMSFAGMISDSSLKNATIQSIKGSRKF